MAAGGTAASGFHYTKPLAATSEGHAHSPGREERESGTAAVSSACCEEAHSGLAEEDEADAPRKSQPQGRDEKSLAM